MLLRSKSGNMLAMIAATAMLLIAAILFGLQFLSVNRGHMEQRTAAEAAALAAVRDIGKIAINTKEYGWVGLTAIAPISKTTIAGDNWNCEVRSINDLLATARLDFIIADQLDDPFMKSLASQELDRINAVAIQLDTAISATLVKGGSAVDVYGNPVSTYDDALAAYLNNNAKQSKYKDQTFVITLGTVSGGTSTALPVPNPSNMAQVNPSQMVNSNYLSDTNLPYKQINGGAKDIDNFYLASSGLQPSLVDITKWQAASANQIASVIKVEADNEFTNQGQTYTQHFIAAATPGGDARRPAAGTFSISFPDGPPPELTSPQDLMGNAGKVWKEYSKTKCDMLSANLDYPTDVGSTIATTTPAGWYTLPKPYPPNATQVEAPDIARIGFYDFLREAGPTVSIQSVINIMKSQFNAPATLSTGWNAPDPGILGKILSLGSVPTGITHLYTINPNGTILYRSKTITPYPYTIAADQQLYAESTSSSGGGIHSKVGKWDLKTTMDIPNNNPPPGPPPPGGTPPPAPLGFISQAIEIHGKDVYDFYMRDLVHQLGTQQGGKHAGEPMDSQYVAQKDSKLSNASSIIQDSSRIQDGMYSASTCTFPDLVGSSPARPLSQSRASVARLLCVAPTRESTCAGQMLTQDDYEIGGGVGTIAPNGQGVPSIVSRQDDFASTSAPPVASIPMYNSYASGPDANGSNARPTYVKNGMSVDLRFRRQVDIGQLSTLYGWHNIGYIGEMDP